MKKDNTILISKDVLLKEYLPTYSNQSIITPNISELASKGSVFHNHYTTAPSTAMAVTSMFTGKYPHQLDRKKYDEVTQVEENLFNFYEEKGYKTHLIWSENYNKMALKYTKCFGENTKFHSSFKMNQSVGVHKKQESLKKSKDESAKVFNYIRTVFESIDYSENNFVWLHLPHVIKGRTSYGDDIDLFDDIVGLARDFFNDNNIYITADHGHMNGHFGKTTYGFDVYDVATNIPLITPFIGQSNIYFPTSHVQLFNLITTSSIKKLDFIVIDTAYFQQPNRKVAIVKDMYKLVYVKKRKSFELYDLEFDKYERVNLLKRKVFDYDRWRNVNIFEVYKYPKIDTIDDIFLNMKDIFDSFYIEAGPFIEIKNSLILKIKKVKRLIKTIL